MIEVATLEFGLYTLADVGKEIERRSSASLRV